jgi:AcrR family transcriptional regulator
MPRSETTQERLLKAAADAIDKGGEAAVKIREIAKKGNVTAPSVYHFFGSREGLVEAALAYRYLRGLATIGDDFSTAVHRAKSKVEFTKIAHSFIALTFARERIHIRKTRVNVLGSAQYRPSLSKELARAQDAANKNVGETLRYAQSKGWIRKDFDPEMFAAWFTGMAHARLLIELDGEHSRARNWDVIALRSVCQALGIAEPIKKKRTTRAS